MMFVLEESLYGGGGVETRRGWVLDSSLLTWLYFQSEALPFLIERSTTGADSCVPVLYKGRAGEALAAGPSLS